MTESYVFKDKDFSKLKSIVRGYYIEDTPKSVLIELPNGTSFWVPKRYIDSEISKDTKIQQNIMIQDWILKKIGFKI
ncbi:MAG: hypothetical protein HWN81_18720 [Candidatus Lokiarchaeota archaeon]|nr:hypothetical protein [Candidatus Lokiarchaeota archaeon]